VSELKKKDDYQKALSLYSQGIKDFRRRDYEKALSSFESLVEKFPEEHELVDRARVYLTICQKSQKKESANLKTVEDYLFMLR